jgi:hypothetical protein
VAFQDYTLANLRDELKVEFGLSTADNARVVRKVNDAQKWIIRKRNGLWPWQVKELVINVPSKKTGTANFTQDSATVTWVSGTPKPDVPTADREIISQESVSTDLTEGYMITAFSDPTITIDANYTGTTSTPGNYTVVKGYFQLPDDFQRMLSVYDMSLQRGRIIQRSAREFEEIRRDQRLAVGTERVYAVTKDPFPEGNVNFSDRLYLGVYPYIGERKTLRGIYVADVQDMTADGDVPLIPRNNREVIFWVAAWQLALSLKETAQAEAYKGLADEALQDMLREYELAVDQTRDSSPFINDIGPVMPPPGYPHWRLPS